MIGITAVNGVKYDIEKRYAMLREAGFESVMLRWGDNDCVTSRLERVKLVEKSNLYIENAHAQAKYLNSLWRPGEHGDAVLQMLKNSVTDCALYGVPTLVMHISNGDNPPPISNIGLRRVEQLIECAEKSRVMLAVENVREPLHVRYVLDNYDSPYLGLCYDSGHQNIWSKDVDWLTLYTDRIAAIHLHDNFGDVDTHLIPGDGDINWNTLISKLSKTSYNGTFTLETQYHVSSLYNDISYEAFLTRLFTTSKGFCEQLKSNSK